MEQSIFRGGSYSLTLKSFNPPAMARSWVNRYALENGMENWCITPPIRTCPAPLLGERFWADAEHLRATNPEAYRHEYGGEVVGSGAAVFANLQLRCAGRRNFDVRPNVSRRGLGLVARPVGLQCLRLRPGAAQVDDFDELTRFRCPNADTAQLFDRAWCGRRRGRLLIADGAEPKSCADYRAAGLPCRAARKGPGSLRESMKWLQSLAEIVIDPARCPDTAREFGEYEYAKDARTGEVLGGYP